MIYCDACFTMVDLLNNNNYNTVTKVCGVRLTWAAIETREFAGKLLKNKTDGSVFARNRLFRVRPNYVFNE